MASAMLRTGSCRLGLSGVRDPRSPRRRPRAAETPTARRRAEGTPVRRRPGSTRRSSAGPGCGRARSCPCRPRSLALQVGDCRDGRVGVHQDLIARAAAVVGGHHLDLGVGCGAEDRRRVTGDREVDLARGGRLDLRRSEVKVENATLYGSPSSAPAARSSASVPPFWSPTCSVRPDNSDSGTVAGASWAPELSSRETQPASSPATSASDGDASDQRPP